MDVYKLRQHFISSEKPYKWPFFWLCVWRVFESSDRQTDQNLCIQVAQERLPSLTHRLQCSFPLCTPAIHCRNLKAYLLCWQTHRFSQAYGTKERRTRPLIFNPSAQHSLPWPLFTWKCSTKIVKDSSYTRAWWLQAPPGNSRKRLLQCIKQKPLPFCVSNNYKLCGAMCAFMPRLCVRHYR